MAFMKSVVQISSAIENLKGPGDFQFAQKTTLTAIIVVSGGPGAWAAWSLTLGRVAFWVSEAHSVSVLL